jgi:hypothetical protein
LELSKEAREDALIAGMLHKPKAADVFTSAELSEIHRVGRDVSCKLEVIKFLTQKKWAAKGRDFYETFAPRARRVWRHGGHALAGALVDKLCEAAPQFSVSKALKAYEKRLEQTLARWDFTPQEQEQYERYVRFVQEE